MSFVNDRPRTFGGKMNKRWVKRDENMILQYCVSEPIEEWKQDPSGGLIQFKILKNHKYTWYDVPVCNEETGEEE